MEKLNTQNQPNFDENIYHSDHDDNEKVDLESASKLIANLNSFAREAALPRKRKNRHETREERFDERKKLEVQDLRSAVTDSSLIRSLQSLPTPTPNLKSSSRKRGKLNAPLPKLHQQRLEREAAYNQTKDSLGRWKDTVKQLRDAEKISFPLKIPSKQAIGEGAHGLSLHQAVDSHALTELEAKVSECLKESGTSSEKQMTITETLGLRRVDEREARRRTAQLRMIRELHQRDEIRAKRLKKIKSKTYRKILRRDKDRLTKYLNEGENEDHFNNDADDTTARRRAEERMRLKHSQSRWAQQMRNSGRSKWDEDAKDGLTQNAKLQEDLKKKVMGDESEDGFDDVLKNHEDWEDGGPDQDEFHTNHQIDEGDVSQVDGLMGMKFMQAAERKRRAKEQYDLSSVDGPKNALEKVGRRVFNDGLTGLPRHVNNVLENQTAGLDTKSNGHLNFDLSHETVTRKIESSKNPELNPWLEIETDSNTRKRQPSIKTKSYHNEGGSTGIITGSETEISPTAYLQPKHGKSSINSRSTSNETGAGMQEPRNELPFTSGTDLIERAFAGDEVVDETLAIDDNLEQIMDTVPSDQVPGWGNWAETTRNRKKVKTKAYSSESGILNGGDRSKKDLLQKTSRTIISEKRVKKSLKYMATNLPFPFESREQYERSLRFPIGQEWSTKQTYRDMTTPRVLVEAGKVVEPIYSPL